MPNNSLKCETHALTTSFGGFPQIKSKKAWKILIKWTILKLLIIKNHLIKKIKFEKLCRKSKRILLKIDDLHIKHSFFLTQLQFSINFHKVSLKVCGHNFLNLSINFPHLNDIKKTFIDIKRKWVNKNFCHRCSQFWEL